MKKSPLLLFSLVVPVALWVNSCVTPNNQAQNQQPGTPAPEVPAEQEQQQGTVKEFSVVAKQWEFEPSQITVNKDDVVRLKIRSIDVKHGIAIPEFNVNADVNPGEETVVEFTADKVGTFTFSCSVFCGTGHRDMKGTLIVQ